MKNKIFVLLVGLFLVTGCSIFEKEEPKKLNINESESLKDKRKTEDEMLFILIEYGKEIYRNKLYLGLEKADDGTYFISANTLKEKFNYDVSMIDEKCDLDRTGIGIDVDRKVFKNKSLNEAPIVGVLGCE